MIAIQQTVADHLEELLEEVRTGKTASPSLYLEIADGTFIADFKSLNELAGSFTSLVYGTQKYRKAAKEKVRAIADQLSQRIRYLPEPVVLVECDPEAAKAQIRSEQPATTTQGICYYEIEIDGEGVLLSRYRKPEGRRRHKIEMTLTHEILARLIGDILAATE